MQQQDLQAERRIFRGEIIIIFWIFLIFLYYHISA